MSSRRAHILNTYGTGRESPKYIKQKPKWGTIIVCSWWVRRAKPSENTGPRGSTAKSSDCCQGSPGLLELHQQYSPGQTISIIHTAFSTSGFTQETVPHPEANWKLVIVACFLFLTVEYLDTKQSIHNQSYEDASWKIRIYLTIVKKNMLRAVGLHV